MRPEDEAYFQRLETDLEAALSVAEAARSRGGDPASEVEIPVARDMADRVENILGIDGVAERVRDLEESHSREEAALEIAADFAEGTVGDYDTREGKVEGAVRTAVALLTEGVVAAPIEGIDSVELAENSDGSEFVRVFYAGPVRSAGGTAQALSVLVADYTRALLDMGGYQPREDEVERYAEELDLYDQETGLQYSPTDSETKFIAEHCPVMLDGEATGQKAVSGFRDLERIDTNNPRGGMCLVLAEGIAQKAPKIKRYTDDLEEVDWPWLDDLIEGTYKKTDTESEAGDSPDESEPEADDPVAGETDSGDGEPDAAVAEQAAAQAHEAVAEPEAPLRPDSSKKYLRDLIAGRPVFGHPSEAGGFRLRYGRSRNHGFATAGVHPATMHVIDDFLATGTQIKTERPGKAAGVIPVDSIDGPTVKLANGDVRRIDDPEEALEIRNGVTAILDLGEYLVNYGEFVENNHDLVPASYVAEWWVQDMAAAGADVQAFRDSARIDLEHPTPEQALSWATEYDAPLHPEYTYLWNDLPIEAFGALADAVSAGHIDDGVLCLENTDDVRSALETLLVEHSQGERLEIPTWRPLVRSLGLTEELERVWETLSGEARRWDDGENATKAVCEVAPFEIRERAPTRVGCRMGRPEKSEKREMSPAVHTLFPIGEAGGNQRNVSDASTYADGLSDTPGEIEVELGVRACGDCGMETYKARCPECAGRTAPTYECPDCSIEVECEESGRAVCPRCEAEVGTVERQRLDFRSEYRRALDAVGERENAFDILKGVKGLTSARKVPEPLEKGVLRAKHDVSAFKDGTVRFDMTDLPVTSVCAAELDVSVEQLRELGYDTDIHDEALRHDDQLLYLRSQDIVLSDGAAEHMLKTAAFVDDLLESYYDLDPYYEFEARDDLVGELVFGMAPHTSAAVVGRVVGFTSASVGYAHPYFHAAKRRNCFHPETTIQCIDESGTHWEESIQSVVDARLEQPRTDDVGTLIQDLDGTLSVPSITEAGELTTNPVEAVSKHAAPEHLVRISTESGRELRVTPDHDVQVLDSDGEVSAKRASELTTQDKLVRPSAAGSQREVAESRSAESPSSPTQLPDGGRDGATLKFAEAETDPNEVSPDPIDAVEYDRAETDVVYCLTVAETHSLLANGLGAKQCDGDEDCVMLLMDGLLNFSKSFLPESRGGRMDAPLVMSSRIDPTEIDDEAHNVDIVEQYPRSFYEATRRMAEPGEVDITIAEETLETEQAYAGFPHTHDTSNLALGPDLSAYKTLESMTTKMDAQLELARKLRGVEESDVAERIIEGHFLPDLIGNLRAFSSQETRCLDCGESYRRVPLTGDCRECGGDMNLTVHEGSVNKYLDTAIEVAEEYGSREYTKQRLDILKRSIESVFENDKNKQSGIADFM